MKKLGQNVCDLEDLRGNFTKRGGCNKRGKFLKKRNLPPPPTIRYRRVYLADTLVTVTPALGNGHQHVSFMFQLI